jgi:RNHCP domain
MSRNKILRNNPQESFICLSCGKGVAALEYGGQHRNHCPNCLSSYHVDIIPGDRRSSCCGIMEPIGVCVQKNKEWSVIHRCSQCRIIRLNRIASDDNELLLFTLAAEPMMTLPFPSKKAISTLHRLSLEKGKEVEQLY